MQGSATAQPVSRSFAALAGRTMSMWSALGLTVSTPLLTWWLTAGGDQGWPDHDWGPFHLPVRSEIAVGVGAAAVAVGSLIGAVVADQRVVRGRIRLLPTACLVLAGAIAAGGWRVMTASVVGANIGGAGVFFLAPLLIGGLLVASVFAERHSRRGALSLTTLRLFAAAVTTFLLFLVPLLLQAGINNRGHIRTEQFAAVQRGDSRSDVRAHLGRSGEPIDWFFPPVPGGQRCDYFSDNVAQFQICYSADRVVSTRRSTDPYVG